MSDAVVLRSAKLTDAGFSHVFSTRQGGTSEGRFASLNLGRAVGDESSRVVENHARVARAVGYEENKLFETTQVHGAAVVTLRGNEQVPEVRVRKADALLTREQGFAVAVRTADCVPVLLADRKTGTVGAVHAGWRGVVAGILRAAVSAMEGSQSSDLVAAIGPSIGPCCFEVGDDVAAQLGQAAGDGIVIRRGPAKAHVDLWRAVSHQLHGAGVTAVETLGRCTMCEPEQFFSYRRDGAESGRMLSVIMARTA